MVSKAEILERAGQKAERHESTVGKRRKEMPDLGNNKAKPKPKEVPEKKKKSTEKNDKGPSKPTKRGKVGSAIISMIDGTFLTKDYFLRKLPFIFFLTLLSIVYIANTYYAERTTRRIEKLKIELKEMKSEYITIKSEYMSKLKQSEVVKSLETTPGAYEIIESKQPPKKIDLRKNNSGQNITDNR